VKYLGPAGYPKPLFGLSSLGGGKGPWDKLTLEGWGYDAVALMAANPSHEQVRFLQELRRPLVPQADSAGNEADIATMKSRD
jgi:hypothetical protein